MADHLMPPVWAERVLCWMLPVDDRETVPGDLLEMYRDTIVPMRGRAAADRWYVGQVLGFAWRSAWVWITLFSAAQIARTALDWFIPVSDFGPRSMGSTAIAASILIAAGFLIAWRTRTLVSAALVGAGIAFVAAIASAVVAVAMLIVWHDPSTVARIDASGGLGEALTMPVFLILPGLVLGLAGGIAAMTGRRLRKARGA